MTKETEALCFHQMKHDVPIVKTVIFVAREEINLKGGKGMLQNVIHELDYI
jgi:hypothetical protein